MSIAQKIADHRELIATQERLKLRTHAPILACMADIEPQPISWLWPKRIALGKLTMLAGDPGLGKSTIALDLISRVTTGSPWPDGTPCPIGSAIIMTAEDGLADTVRPRLDRAGADVSRVHALQGIETAATRKQRSVTLDDLFGIEAAIEDVPDCKIIVVDPVSAFINTKRNADSHNNTDVRGMLAPLSAMAEKHGVALLMVSHLSKGSGKAIYRTMGSLAWVAAARAAYVVVKDPDDDGRRMMLPVKNNIGDDRTGFAYRFIDNRLTWERDPIETRADEVTNDEPRRTGPEPERRQDAEAFLLRMLGNGPIATNELKDQAKAAGISWGTVRNAKDTMRIRAELCGYTKRWQWRLPRSGGDAKVQEVPK